MLVGGRASIGELKFAAWMAPFRQGFTAPTWHHVLVLITGAILSPGRRTVAAALRVTGLEQHPCFTNFHRVLNRNRWSSRRVARCLLRLLVSSFVPEGPVVLGLDDTLERRWGAKIKARGIYRDPVRSSHGHFVKASGLRWLSIMLLPEIPWASRVWGLPFLTALAPSERYASKHNRPHKKLTDWGRQILLQASRWSCQVYGEGSSGGLSERGAYKAATLARSRQVRKARSRAARCCSAVRR